MNLTKSELQFLNDQGFKKEDVFDCKGRAVYQYKDAAKASGKQIMLSTPCKNASHRLRNRSGHCVQCDTRKIAFQKRFRTVGYVYIAVSNEVGLVKVGSSTAVNARIKKLNFDKYAGAKDWREIFWVKIDESGHVEQTAHTRLSNFGVDVEYIKDGKPQTSRESFNCRPIVAADEIIEAIKQTGRDCLQSWRDKHFPW